MAEPILLAQHDDIECHLLPALANRHGLVTGATGTGKTITLQTLAENFSRRGVPVFLADVKGDLTGISQRRQHRRQARRGAEGARHRDPRAVRLPDHAVGRVRRAGPPGAGDRQRHGPAAARAHAGAQRDPAGRAEPRLQGRRRQRPAAARPEGPARDAAARRRQRGAVHHRATATSARPASARSSAGCCRSSEQGGEHFFGEPMLNIADFMQTADGKGVVNILAADKLMNSPRLYATFLLWMLSELFEQAARGGRPRRAQAGVLLRRGAPAVQGRAGGAGRAHRTRRAAGPLQGRRRVLRDAEPARHPGQRAGAARQPGPARAARVHAARPEGGEGGGRHDARQPGARRRDRDHRARRRRGAGQPARRQGPALPDRARLRDAAGQPDRTDHARAAPGADRRFAGGRRLREDGRPRIGLREAQGPRRRRRRHAGRLGRRRRACHHGRRRHRPGDSRRRAARRPEGRAVRHRPARAAASTRAWPNRRRARRCARIGSSVGREIVRGVLGSLLGGSRRR